MALRRLCTRCVQGKRAMEASLGGRGCGFPEEIRTQRPIPPPQPLALDFPFHLSLALGRGLGLSLSSSSFIYNPLSLHTLSSKQVFFSLISLSTSGRVRACAGSCPRIPGHEHAKCPHHSAGAPTQGMKPLTAPHTLGGHGSPHYPTESPG